MRLPEKLGTLGARGPDTPDEQYAWELPSRPLAYRGIPSDEYKRAAKIMLAKPKTDTKQVDRKGRITLDRRFANRVVMIEEVDDTEVRITLARVIPEREVWLYDNPEAKKAVLTGIDQARSMQLVEAAPDLAADRDLGGGIGKRHRSQAGTKPTAKARRARRGHEEDSNADVFFAFVVALFARLHSFLP